MDDPAETFRKDVDASLGQCIRCRVKPRFKHDLHCEACMAEVYPQPVQRAGLTVTPCRCNCGYTCDRRKCGLPLMECIDQHWRRDCDHQWDGEWNETELPGGGSCGEVTCSKCGASSMAHDCAVGP